MDLSITEKRLVSSNTKKETQEYYNYEKNIIWSEIIRSQKLEQNHKKKDRYKENLKNRF